MEIYERNNMSFHLQRWFVSGIHCYDCEIMKEGALTSFTVHTVTNIAALCLRHNDVKQLVKNRIFNIVFD